MTYSIDVYIHPFFKFNYGYQLSLRPEIDNWFEENIKDNWTYFRPHLGHRASFYFVSAQDAILFKMRWL